MKKTISLLCTSLVCLALLVGVASAQIQEADSAPVSSVPTSNPEPVAWAALLGGAVLAGGIACLLRQPSR